MTPLQMVDVALGAALAEACALALWRYRRGPGPSGQGYYASLLAGGFLLVALRVALASPARGAWVGLALAGALLAHLVDLRQRWRG